MLGRTLSDPEGADGEAGNWPGLDLLPLVTRYEAHKRVGRASGSFTGLASGPWRALNGVEVSGYEIRQGRTSPLDGQGATAVLRDREGQPLAWAAGSVLATSVHGLFESPAVLRALFGVGVKSLDDSFDALAEMIDSCFAPGLLARLCE
jgi:adenosylcobyric acid synthase